MTDAFSKSSHNMDEEDEDPLLLRKHVKLAKMSLDVLPSDYCVFDSTRPTVLFFILSSLDLLGQLDKVLSDARRQEIIDWLYTLQLSREPNAPSNRCGFRGSAISPPDEASNCLYDSAHLAQTYTALCSLLILGDDLSRVDRAAVLSGVAACQCADGSVCGTGDRDSENDMRFLFCAVAICYILNDFSHLELNSLFSFVRRSFNYDAGFGQGPGRESHGGSTFCAVASLSLLNRLWDGSVLDSRQIERLKRWAVLKQDEGFHGRTNKPDDSCYAFWVGATLAILNAQSLVNWPALRAFLMRNQDRVIGGFCKYEDSSHSDLLHTHFSLAALGIFGEPLVRPVFPALNITNQAHEHLMRIWRKSSGGGN